MKSVTLLGLGAALLLGAAPAAGQSIDSPYRFVEHNQAAGAQFGHFSMAKGPRGLGPEDALAFGARYGITVTGPFVVELELLFSPTTRTVIDTTFTMGPESERVVAGESDVSLLVGLASVRFNVTGPRTWHRIQPYVLLGGGMATDLAKASAADEEVGADVRFDFGSSFAGHLGLGAEYHVTPRWTVRAEARNILWKLKNPTAFRVQDEERRLPASQWESNTGITAGFSIRF